MAQRFEFKSASEMPPMSVSLGDMSFNKTGSWRYLRPYYVEKLAPCRAACPLGTDIPLVLRLIGEGKFSAAQSVIRQSNPIPGILGRVCYHTCEAACNRIEFDQALSIRALERFTSEATSGLPFESPPTVCRLQKVAVVGSGPAGLSCAYYLAKEGFRVRVFEADTRVGGMLRQGIPAYRLPREVLDREIGNIENLGVEILRGVQVGQDIPLSTLRRDYAAIFVATGAHASRELKIEGESLPGVWAGLDFLKAVNKGTPPSIGSQTLIIGGGNTAMDSARVALRLDSEATVLYRRGRDQMPAMPEEIKDAEDEGVQFIPLAAPVHLRRKKKRLEVTCLRMKLGAPDESGRARPVPIEGSEFTKVVDTVIKAIGETAAIDLEGQQVPDKAKGELDVLHNGNLFIGGDAATGPSSVAEAARNGREVAWAILKLLDPDSAIKRFLPTEPVPASGINTEYFQNEERAQSIELPAGSRTADFSEVLHGLSLQTALMEARRCFSCGACDHCDTCWVFCPDNAIKRVDGEYQIDLDTCKGCGICAQECPRGVISLAQEIQ